MKAEGYAPLAKLVAVPEIRHQEGERSFTGWMTLHQRTPQGRIFKERATLERTAYEKIIHDWAAYERIYTRRPHIGG